MHVGRVYVRSDYKSPCLALSRMNTCDTPQPPHCHPSPLLSHTTLTSSLPTPTLHPNSPPGETSLYDNGRLMWRVTRGKGKVIPSGGTLVVGREQDCRGGCFDSRTGARGSGESVGEWGGLGVGSSVGVGVHAGRWSA